MAMSEADRTAAMRRIVLEMFVKLKATAIFDTVEIKAAVDAIDDVLDSLISTHLGTDTIVVAINKTLPEPFKSASTNAQKSLVFRITVEEKFG